MFMIALLCFLLSLVALLLCRSQPAPPPTRHVSFSDTSYPPSLSTSSPNHKHKPLPPDPPRSPQLDPVDQFGRLPSPPPLDLRPSPKFARRVFSLTGRRRSSSASCTSTLIHIDTRTPPTSPPLSSPSSRRPRFVNPFSKHSRSRTLSPPSTPERSPTKSSGLLLPSPSPAGRRSLVNKFKSLFKSTSPESSPAIPSKPVDKTTNTKPRRKSVARTQPYGPPWNAPMPVPEFTLSPHSVQKPAQPLSPSPKTARKCSLPRRSSTSPGELSPCSIFINELDEKLSLLQQRVQDPIPSPYE